MRVSHAGREHPRTDLSYSAFSPSRKQTNTALSRAQVVTMNHTVSVNYVVWLELPGVQRHCYQARSSKGSEVTSPEQLRARP